MGLWNFLLWWGALPLQVVLLLLMVRWRSFRGFPWFFTYNAYSVLATGLRLLLFSRAGIYPYVYWISEAGYAVIGIVVMYEVFRDVLRSLVRLWWVRVLFLMTVLPIFGLTVLLTRSITNDLTPLMTFIMAGEMCARVIEVAMFVLLIVLVAVLGFRWRMHGFGICAGFGIYSSCALLASTRYYEIGSRFNFWWSVISVVSYTVAVLIWLWYFSTPIAAETPRNPEPPLSLQDLERYKHVVRRTQRP